MSAEESTQIELDELDRDGLLGIIHRADREIEKLEKGKEALAKRIADLERRFLPDEKERADRQRAFLAKIKGLRQQVAERDKRIERLLEIIRASE